MTVVTFRTKEIGLDKPIKVKKSYEQVQQVSEIKREINNAQIKNTKRQLADLDDETNTKIKRLKDEIEVEPTPEKENELKKLQLTKELHDLEAENSDIEDGKVFFDKAVDSIAKLLNLDDEQIETVKKNISDPEKLGNYIGYVSFKVNGGTDADYDKARKEQELKNKTDGVADPKKS